MRFKNVLTCFSLDLINFSGADSLLCFFLRCSQAYHKACKAGRMRKCVSVGMRFENA